MQKFFVKLFSSESSPVPAPPSAPIQAPYDVYFRQAQAAAQRQDWESAQSAYEAGLAKAIQDNHLRARQFFLSGLGTILYKKKNYVAADKYLNESLELARQVGDPILEARCLINLGEVSGAQQDWESAKTYQEQALELARTSHDTLTQLIAQESLAKNYIEQGNPAYAIHLLKDAISAAQEHQDPRMGASLVGWLGEAHIAKGERGQGRRFLEQAQRLAIQVGRDGVALQWVKSLAKLDMAEKDYLSAIERFQATEDLGRRIGYQPKDFFIEIALSLAEAYHATGNYPLALQQAERAQLHAQEYQDAKLKRQADWLWGLAQQGLGKHDVAADALQGVYRSYEAESRLHEANEKGLLATLGKSLLRLQRHAESATIFEQALDLARQNGDTLREAEALHLLGSVKSGQIDQSAAIELWKQAIRIYEGHQKYAEAARVLCDIGNVRRLSGDLSAATTDFENALTYLSQIDDRVTRGLVLSNAANLYTQVGDVATAEAFYQESIKIASELKDVHSESVRKGNLAWFYVLTGKMMKALQLFDEALTISQSLNDPLLQAIQTNNSGYAYAKNDRHDTAIKIYEQAFKLVEALNSPRWIAIIESNMAYSMVALGRLDEANMLYEQALRLSTDTGDKESIIRTQHRLANLRRLQGRQEEGRELAENAYNEARRMGYRKGQGDAARVLGDIYQDLGEANNATLYFAEAHKVYSRISDPLAEQYAQYAT